MNFTLKNQTPHLTWNQDEGAAGVLSFDGKPLSAFWKNVNDQDENTVFLVSFPDCQHYRDEINQAIGVDLFTDYSYQEETLHQELGRLFELLPNGEYNLQVSNSEEHVTFPGYPFSTSTNGSYQNDYFNFLLPTTPPKSKLSHTAWYEKSWETEQQVEKTTYKIDEGLDMCFISTVPTTFIDPKRVDFYEDAIKKDNRPAIIVFRCFEADGEGFNYVLDGHCKLLAYANQGVMPHFIFITQERANHSLPITPWDLTPFIYLLSPWQANSFLEHFSSFKLQDSKGNFQALSPFIESNITETIEIFWAHDRTMRSEHYFKDGHKIASLYLGYLNDKPSTSFSYTAQHRQILYRLSGNRLEEIREHSLSNGEFLHHEKWNEETGMLEAFPIEKTEPYKAPKAQKGAYKPLWPSWREKYKNEIYYVLMGLFMLFMLLRLLSTCS